jgi:hydrogenase maturation protease
MTKRKPRITKLLVVGIGNSDRGDDGVGPLVAQRLVECIPADLARHVTILERGGDALALIDDWAGRDAVILVDAAAPVSAPGRIHRFDLLEEVLPIEISLSSTHAFGVADAVGLARTLGLLPNQLVVYAIEGADFDLGSAVSGRVFAAAADVVVRIIDELKCLERDVAQV